MQAGGGESGLTDSLLETPTYVLSIVFMMFLVGGSGDVVTLRIGPARTAQPLCPRSSAALL